MAAGVVMDEWEAAAELRRHVDGPDETAHVRVDHLRCVLDATVWAAPDTGDDETRVMAWLWNVLAARPTAEARRIVAYVSDRLSGEEVDR